MSEAKHAGRPATRTVLLHMEDFKIPENLSRFAVKCGMWGFIKQMTPHLVKFTKARRAAGVAPTERDPNAFGAPSAAAAAAAPPPLRPSPSAGAALGRTLSKHRPALRRVASAVFAGGMLVALGSASARSGSEGNLRRRGSAASQLSQRDGDDDE